MYRKTTLSFNDAVISAPDGIACGITENPEIGYVSLQYAGNPEECYEVYKVFNEWFNNRKLFVKVKDNE